MSNTFRWNRCSAEVSESRCGRESRRSPSTHGTGDETAEQGTGERDHDGEGMNGRREMHGLGHGRGGRLAQETAHFRSAHGETSTGHTESRSHRTDYETDHCAEGDTHDATDDADAQRFGHDLTDHATPRPTNRSQRPNLTYALRDARKR